MHEGQILDMVESLTLGTLTLEEKAIIVADIKSELGFTRLAQNTTSLILQKVSDLSNGLYKESQALPKVFQDFSGHADNDIPFAVTNQEEIDDFLEKMISKEPQNNPETYFGDTWEFYHPTANMVADGLPTHRSNFNTQY
jgi:hypothetical protein